MKTRKIIFESSVELILKDKFGNDLSGWVVYKCDKNTKNAEINTSFELAIPQKDGYYQSKDDERFYIYDGEGDLKLNECKVKWDFAGVNIIFLDFYLANGEHARAADEKDKEKIENFVKFNNLYGKNDKLKINPPYYEAILDKLVIGL